MRRADRLFQIVQHLRARRLTTAAQLAGWLGISERTVYRDIRDLSTSGVPILGEAGVGYRIHQNYDLTPLMFTYDEIEAVVLGIRMVEAFGGPALTDAARSALTKVALALPKERRAEVDSPQLYAPSFRPNPLGDLIEALRQSILAHRKLAVVYRDEGERETKRRLRPLALYFWGAKWTLATWCESRKDFRNFRLDRISACEVLEEVFKPEAGKDLDAFLEKVRANIKLAEREGR